MKPQYLNTLHQYASEYRFSEFSELLLAREAEMSRDTLKEALLMQVQIKLYASDGTLLDDLNKAEALDDQTPLRFPCLETQWVPDNIDRFISFPAERDAFEAFVACLPRAEKELRRWYGDAGAGMVHQIWSELYYFRGDMDQALFYAKKRYNACKKNRPLAMLAQFELFRSHLAKGEIIKAEQYMLDIVRSAKISPESTEAYNNARAWTNVTTGWSGDNPRYELMSDDDILPLLEDREMEVKNGIGVLSSKEKFFALYAKEHYDNIYGGRRFYMDVYHAIRLFNQKAYAPMMDYFLIAYRFSLNTGLIMPFVEYGKQLIPLLEYIKENESECNKEWLDRIITLSVQYEQCILAYRLEEASA